MSITGIACELCVQPGGEVAYQEEKFRVVMVDDAQYPGFCRVIWNDHIQEMTDLSVLDRILLMDAVWQVEAALRDVMQPDKINIACLGNMVPHLHWHVIPRDAQDAHFPAPIWAQAQRIPDSTLLAARVALLPLLRTAIVRNFN